jgi:hypothetical protein
MYVPLVLKPHITERWYCTRDVRDQLLAWFVANRRLCPINQTLLSERHYVVSIARAPSFGYRNPIQGAPCQLHQTYCRESTDFRTAIWITHVAHGAKK